MTVRDSSVFKSIARIVLATMLIASIFAGLPVNQHVFASQISDVADGSDTGHHLPRSNDQDNHQSQNVPNCCDMLPGSFFQFLVFPSANGCVDRSSISSASILMPDDSVISRTTDVELPPPRILAV